MDDPYSQLPAIDAGDNDDDMKAGVFGQGFPMSLRDSIYVVIFIFTNALQSKVQTSTCMIILDT